MTENRTTLLSGLLDATLDAARLILSHYESDVDVMKKDDKSPVTIADQQAEEILLMALGKFAPHIPVVAEEEVAAGRVPPDLGETFFLVDPLDGTKEFLKQNGQFTVNIGLIEKGIPTLGIVYAPARGEMFFTPGGDQAFAADVEAADGTAKKVEALARPIRARTAPADGITAVSSGSHKHEAVEDILKQFNVVERREIGSSLKFCLIAKGEADVYPRQPQSSCEWDVAAAHAVLQAAGGSVTCLDGTVFDYGHADRKFLNPGFVAKGKSQ